MKENFLRILFVFIFLVFCITGKAQPDTTYSIVVAGHAYGAHDGKNIGLHHPFMQTLKANIDSTVKKIFLTGDIVNHSTVESWNQVEKELDSLQLKSYYVMGNHDNNTLGYTIFQEKHGGAFYSFSEGNEIFIVLNSTESDRSISPAQLDFLENVLTESGSEQKRVFIFFHEVIWNSHEKYKDVRSNSRSRYDQMIGHSNFWEEVYPMFTEYNEKEFYLFAGDVGGNPDAVSASYDKWENVTLLSSGMGEVKDENYLKTNIFPDTVTFTLIPLNKDVEMNSVQWYNIPEKPLQIIGSEKITPPQFNLNYQVSPVFNATGYHWIVSDGITGIDDVSSIYLSFNENFKSGEISAQAVNDGFGESEPVVLEIKSENATANNEIENKREIIINQNEQSIIINYPLTYSSLVKLRIYNIMGSLILSEEFEMNFKFETKNINKNIIPGELVILEVKTGKFVHKQKMFLY